MTKDQKAAARLSMVRSAAGRKGGLNSGGARPGAGRPRKSDRCPCGEMTAARAAARRHACESHGWAADSSPQKENQQ